jgi:hypothetical protein
MRQLTARDRVLRASGVAVILLQPRPLYREAYVTRRRRVKQTVSLQDRLLAEAKRLFEEAARLGPGIEREQFLRRARSAEAVSHMSDWIAAPRLKPPNRQFRHRL